MFGTVKLILILFYLKKEKEKEHSIKYINLEKNELQKFCNFCSI